VAEPTGCRNSLGFLVVADPVLELAGWLPPVSRLLRKR
jgi:hypothetical protein